MARDLAQINGSANGTLHEAPPHDPVAEAAVVGSLLLEADAIGHVLDFLEPEDFYRKANEAVYRAALSLFREGVTVDSVTLAAALEKAEVLERVGGRAQLLLLRESVPGGVALNVEHYARIVKDRSYKRAVLVASRTLNTLGQDESIPGDEAVNQAQAAVFAIATERARSGLRHVRDFLKPAIDRVHEVREAGSDVTGIPSGFVDLDRLTNGWQSGDLILVAARPAMGKTAIACGAAVNAAVKHRRKVAIFSMEMSNDQLLDRMLCEQAGVDSGRVRRGMVSDRECELLTNAAGVLGDSELYFDDTPRMDDLTLRLKARQAKVREGVELIVIDYLQLMHAAGQSASANRVQDVSQITRSLKAVARELGIPVIALSQLSRAPEARPDKRPQLSDLRESGSLEQDADLVLFLYRDDYYNREKSEKPGIAEVILAKHRNGPTGTVELVFRRELTRFENLERRHAALEPTE